MDSSITLDSLWQQSNFSPTPSQREAITQINGPLFLTAGPGSGKTRVLLWRTVNLLVFHEVKPEDIFLSTFTEKAAHQLKEGLKNYLGLVTNLTGKPYDIAKMYVGTIHSLCQQMLADRRINPTKRGKPIKVLDDLQQYFFIANRKQWRALMEAGGLDTLPEEAQNETINAFFAGARVSQSYVSKSRFEAINSCIAFFNRLSEENADIELLLANATDDFIYKLLQMYKQYRELLSSDTIEKVDYSLLQQKGYDFFRQNVGDKHIFQHIIIDEYQDTNTIQEKLFFKLAERTKNICVVGDDDQALYRFRGATVENFVEFPDRCQQYLNVRPIAIPLNINYRSRQRIVDHYTNFISRIDWQKEERPGQFYRIHTKNIQANSKDSGLSVVASTPGSPDDVAREIAALIRQLIDSGKVKDPNQIAFLFPSLKAKPVQAMTTALEEQGLRVYAPRAGRFLEVPEAMDVFGIYLKIFGRPDDGHFGGDYRDYQQWMDRCLNVADSLFREDKGLKAFVEERKTEIDTALRDYNALQTIINRNQWEITATYQPAVMKRALLEASSLSPKSRSILSSVAFERIVLKRIKDNDPRQPPFRLKEVITRATSLDWTILDLFYRLSGFNHFKEMYDLAERSEDEGPICNLALITQYLARFIELYSLVLTANFLSESKFRLTFFMSFLYALFRRGESEFENQEDPFPKGRIPFLTIHQAKGLEFPVVVLGSLRRDDRGVGVVERSMHQLIPKEGEPLHRMPTFDTARLFYVALSRPKSLMVLAHFRGQGQRVNEPFNTMLAHPQFPRITDFNLETLPETSTEEDKPPKAYSYTADYLQYERCARQYMVFRRYGFVPSRSQTQFFGNLVHRTIEDLHLKLIEDFPKP
jgi:DNA helicase II / ATP-dependent DNA helicase PcrA